MDESDPKSVARWMRKMGKEMGDELGGGEIDEIVDEMEGSSAREDGGDGDDL